MGRVAECVYYFLLKGWAGAIESVGTRRELVPTTYTHTLPLEHTNATQLEEMVRAKIDAAFAESVTFAPEVDAFDEAISAAVKVGSVYIIGIYLCGGDVLCGFGSHHIGMERCGCLLLSTRP